MGTKGYEPEERVTTLRQAGVMVRSGRRVRIRSAVLAP